MKQRNLASLLLAGAMTAALLTGPAQAAESPSPQEIAATRLQAEGLMNGDEHGDLHLDKGLTRAELACLISPSSSTQSTWPGNETTTPSCVPPTSPMYRSGRRWRWACAPLWAWWPDMGTDGLAPTTRSARRWPAPSCSDTWNETAGLTLPPAARRWNWDLHRRRRWRERPSPVETWPSCSPAPWTIWRTCKPYKHQTRRPPAQNCAGGRYFCVQGGIWPK